MLGFVRSELNKETMFTQQRKAAEGLVEWCESQNGVKVTGNTAAAEAGEELDWYGLRVAFNCFNCN